MEVLLLLSARLGRKFFNNIVGVFPCKRYIFGVAASGKLFPFGVCEVN